MKKINILFACLVLTALLSGSAYSQKKMAQAGMKFLLVSTDARVAAMGDAVTGLEGNSSAMFFNPAAMARINSFADATVGQVNWIADIKYYYGAVAFAPMEGSIGVFGFSFVYVDYGEFQATIRAKNGAGFIDIGDQSPSAYYFGVSYAKALNDKFSIGGNVKYAVQDLTKSITQFANGSYTEKAYKPNGLVFDFGMLYHTGIQSLDFGASVRNFSQEIKLEEEGFQLPLIFKVGLAYNASDFLNLDKNEHSIQLAIDASHPRDNVEQVDMGIEYKFMNMFSLRAGNSSPNDEHNLTYGLGFQKALGNVNLGVDYAYTPWSTFSDVHKFTLHFGF